MARSLIVCHDVVGPAMAGPGIRYWEMSAALQRRGLSVTLAAPAGSQLDGAPFSTVTYRLGEPDLLEAARRADGLLVTGPILEQFPALKSMDVPIAVDLYDPFLFENLHRLRGQPGAGPEHEGGHRTLAEQIRRGDYFVCANDRQRDFYLGALTAWGRVNPTTYDADPSLRSLIDLVPFGLPSEPPQVGRAARGVIRNIGVEDHLVVWNGGLWDWFDPLTAIRAVDRQRREDPSLRLLFLGTRHPNPLVSEPEAARRARRLAQELDLVDRHVFFRDWTPYAERGAFLAEADAAISLHVSSAETRLAARTRLLDCVWAALPVVTTSGDAIGDDLAARGLAIATPEGDETAVAQALGSLLATAVDPTTRAATFAHLAESLTWDCVIDPLARFLASPRPAADRAEVAFAAQTERPADHSAASAEPHTPEGGADSSLISHHPSLRQRLVVALRGGRR